jgi:hypothetical protein
MSTTTPTCGGEPVGLLPARGLLDSIEIRFRLANTGPAPLAVDGRRVGHGLPRRRIPLPELSAVLMHPSTSFEASDEVWRLLVANARAGESKWVVGAVGVALPGLRHAAGRLARSYTGDAQAEVLTGFLAALPSLGLDASRVVQRLVSAAFTQARGALRAGEPARVDVVAGAPGSALPPAPYGHPDFVLARAVTRGVVSVQEAELIGATYLEDVSVAEYAQATGQARWAVYKARARAVARLVAAIGNGSLSDGDAEVVAQATMTVLPEAPQPR